MKATRHNGRSGMGLTMQSIMTCRFDVENSEHIDAERTKFNVYWDCYQGYSLPNDENERARFTFTEAEKAYYVENIQIMWTDRMKEIERHVFDVLNQYGELCPQ